MKKLLLIDTYNFLHRAYHALPKTFKDGKGNPTNAIYGLTSMLINIFDQIKPDYVVAAIDSREPTFRVEDFTGYKAHRKPMESDLEVQIPHVKDIIDAFGVKQVEARGYEADDVIGTMAKKYGQEVEVVIASNDRDLWQAVERNVVVMSPGVNGQAEWLGEKEVEARLGFKPKQLIDFKALRGDPSDNIPGVYGVGEKTAKQLIDKYKTVEEIFKHIDKIEPKSLREKLANNVEEAVMSKHLATIITDTPIDIELEECRFKEVNKARVVEVLKKYNFKSLIKRLGFEPDGSPKKREVPKDQIQLL